MAHLSIIPLNTLCAFAEALQRGACRRSERVVAEESLGREEETKTQEEENSRDVLRKNLRIVVKVKFNSERKQQGD